MSPRTSVRKILGLYEHELNPWLDRVLPRASRVIDVGANDGYFAFGCAAAFQRLRKPAEVIAFEPQLRHVEELRRSIAELGASTTRISVIQAMVGATITEEMTTLDALAGTDRNNTLLKIDVEGAELEVLEGARSWLNRSNSFVIEVHRKEYLSEVRRYFFEAGLKVLQIDQKPVPLIGREQRDEANWWIASNPD